MTTTPLEQARAIYSVYEATKPEELMPFAPALGGLLHMLGAPEPGKWTEGELNAAAAALGLLRDMLKDGVPVPLVGAALFQFLAGQHSVPAPTPPGLDLELEADHHHTQGDHHQ